MHLLFDIGGTHIRAATSENGSRLNEPVTIPTPKRFEDGILKIKELSVQLGGALKFKTIVIGIAGPLNREKTVITGAPNLPDWNNQPLSEKLAKILNSEKLIFENDSALAGLGEAVYGAGRNHNIVAYLTVSTGVGGVRIVNKKIDESAIGFEPGHQIIDSKTGETLESQISGASVKRKTGRNPEDIKDQVFWEEKARQLGIGLNNVIVFWSPDIIVLGGPMMNDINIGKVALHLKKTLKIFSDPPPINRAELGSLNGLYGALALIKQKANLEQRIH